MRSVFKPAARTPALYRVASFTTDEQTTATSPARRSKSSSQQIALEPVGGCRHALRLAHSEPNNAAVCPVALTAELVAERELLPVVARWQAEAAECCDLRDWASPPGTVQEPAPSVRTAW